MTVESTCVIIRREKHTKLASATGHALTCHRGTRACYVIQCKNGANKAAQACTNSCKTSKLQAKREIVVLHFEAIW